MKKRVLFYLLLTLFSITIFTSCEEDVETDLPMDINPIKFTFYLLDKDSVNLLNDSTNRALFMEKVKIIYKNKEYKCTEVLDSLYYSNLWNSEESRALPVFFNGLRIEQTIPISSKYPYVFTFGDFDGTKDYSEFSFTIDWGDGTTDKIFYKDNIEIKKGQLVSNCEFYLNDELKYKGRLDRISRFEYKFVK
ncbi:MAG: hypothetical protein E7080_07060 [Bacteroidales bacterium]|nr:hypothetical protein [Bacteroidales bacterium]